MFERLGSGGQLSPSTLESSDGNQNKWSFIFRGHEIPGNMQLYLARYVPLYTSIHIELIVHSQYMQALSHTVLALENINIERQNHSKATQLRIPACTPLSRSTDRIQTSWGYSLKAGKSTQLRYPPRR